MRRQRVQEVVNVKTQRERVHEIREAARLFVVILIWEWRPQCVPAPPSVGSRTRSPNKEDQDFN